MIEALIAVLIVALILWVIWFLLGKFVSGTPRDIIGIIFALVLALYALERFGLLRTIRL